MVLPHGHAVLCPESTLLQIKPVAPSLAAFCF